MKKILVTGASGFIGRYTLDLLQQAGYLICPLRLNLSNPAAIEQQICDFQAEALLHLAWETTPGQYWHCPTNLDWLKASLSLIETFARGGGKRVVIAGSCAERYPTTTYGACKEALRLSAEAFLKRAQVSFAWGRIFFPYGPYEKQARMIPSAIRALLSQQPFQCSSQDHVRDFLFIEDMARAFVELVQSRVEGLVDMGTGQGISMGELTLRIARTMNAVDLITLSSSPSTVENPAFMLAQADRLYKEVGFCPRYTLQAGLEKTIAWWKQQNLVSCSTY